MFFVVDVFNVNSHTLKFLLITEEYEVCEGNNNISSLLKMISKLQYIVIIDWSCSRPQVSN